MIKRYPRLRIASSESAKAAPGRIDFDHLETPPDTSLFSAQAMEKRLLRQLDGAFASNGDPTRFAPGTVGRRNTRQVTAEKIQC